MLIEPADRHNYNPGVTCNPALAATRIAPHLLSDPGAVF